MNDILLLKQGEIVLKGLNRKYFEQKLISNINRRLARVGRFRVYSVQSTIYAEPLDDAADMDAAEEIMKKTFGIISMSRAAACAKDKDAILSTAREYLHERLSSASSFKVESKRSDKTFPMTSIELSQYVGGELSDEFPNLRPDMHSPELTVNIEVRDYAAYVHADNEPAAGGLPVGVGGRAVSLLSGGIDSPVACYMMAKRGVDIIPVHFFSFPYTSELAKKKVLDIAAELLDYCGRLTVRVVPFTHIQEEIRAKCPEEFFTVIMRRFMMRISEKIALDNGCGALITGEDLGQVASQTMEAIGVTNSAVSLPVFRPLIGMDKEEIVTIARHIGTFETSILPYEDCCTVFTPRRPRTKPVLSEILEAEKALDAEALIEEAFAGIEKIKITK